MTIPPTKIGINISDAPPYETSRTFMNLFSNSPWTIYIQGKVQKVAPPGYLDANGELLKMGAGEMMTRPILRPTGVLQGKPVDLIIRWTGEGTFRLQGAKSFSNATMGPGWLKFTYLPTTSGGLILVANSINAANPPKNFDCREVDADPKARFDPIYVANLKKYDTVRFGAWQNLNLDVPVTWANRTKPGGASYTANPSGYAIEYMIDLANEAKVNAWFCTPWNADADYIRRFATMVRDNLDPSLTVYVENSNEVWNSIFPVYKQALAEGKAAGFPKSDSYVVANRYAQKTGEVMDIWASVFAGQMHRLVRVAAYFQALPFFLDECILAFRDTPTKIDAIATAPYWGVNIDKMAPVNPDDLAPIFKAVRDSLDHHTMLMAQAKAIADKYGKRYITYEGGQNMSGSDNDLLWKVSHDARMGALYTEYLTRWRDEIGDLNMLFNDVSTTSRYGAFGLQDYTGQPLSDAPKAAAVDAFIGGRASKQVTVTMDLALWEALQLAVRDALRVG